MYCTSLRDSMLEVVQGRLKLKGFRLEAGKRIWFPHVSERDQSSMGVIAFIICHVWMGPRQNGKGTASCDRGSWKNLPEVHEQREKCFRDADDSFPEAEAEIE